MPFSKRLKCFSRARAMQPRRALADPQRRVAPHRQSQRGPEAPAVRKAGKWATIIVATALVIAVQRFVANDGVPRELRAVVPSTDCPARYAAFLDLAELARRDGTSSEVVMRGFSGAGGMNGALNACPRLSIGGLTQ
jgi:hypothetical protein